MGQEWREAQAAAMGLGGEGFEEGCRAALRLYEISCDEVVGLLDERQEAVVGRAKAVIRGLRRGRSAGAR
jgi:deferrochelatase/peroxidase EfeB